MLNALTCMLIAAKNDRRGVTALEYGLMASLVGLAIIAAVTTFAGNLSSEFTAIGLKL